VVLSRLNHRKAPQLISSLLISITGCKWAAWRTLQLPRFPEQVCPNSSLAMLHGPLFMLGECFVYALISVKPDP